jgi:hypothetical protein
MKRTHRQPTLRSRNLLLVRFVFGKVLPAGSAPKEMLSNGAHDDCPRPFTSAAAPRSDEQPRPASRGVHFLPTASVILPVSAVWRRPRPDGVNANRKCRDHLCVTNARLLVRIFHHCHP